MNEELIPQIIVHQECMRIVQDFLSDNEESK